MAQLAEIAAYLAWASRQPWNPGSFDCLQGFVSEWVRRQRGGDPAALWRGRYRTELGMVRLMRREGGLMNVLSHGAALAGLQAIDAPQLGCIAAVEMVTRRGIEPVGAIRTARRWAFKTRQGVMTAEGRALGMWAV